MTVALSGADTVRGALADLATAGWSEREGGGVVAFDVWADEARADVAGALRAALAELGVAARVTQAVQDGAWRDGLRRHHRPVEVAGRIRVRPPWTDPVPGLLDVVIDPGMAFGTGQHATTCGCLALLADAPGGSLLDVGCGSGVLAIAAAKLGYAPVTAVDSDPVAVDATVANAAANGVALHALGADAERDPLPAARTLVANILAIPVTALAGRVAEPAPERIVLSGFRPGDAAGVAGAWEARGYRLDRRIDDDGWTALRLVRP